MDVIIRLSSRQGQNGLIVRQVIVVHGKERRRTSLYPPLSSNDKTRVSNSETRKREINFLFWTRINVGV